MSIAFPAGGPFMHLVMDNQPKLPSTQRPLLQPSHEIIQAPMTNAFEGILGGFLHHPPEEAQLKAERKNANQLSDNQKPLFTPQSAMHLGRPQKLR
jgi:hypothetical protein